LFSPALDSRGKVRRLHRCLRAAARHPDTVVALVLDEFGYQRWPEVAPTWGREAAVAQRAGNTQQWRTIGALKALTGQVNYLDGYIVGRQQVRAFSTQLDHVYPVADLLYVIQDNWNIHPHPDVLTALERYPRLKPVWLPTYAPWLNPIEEHPTDYTWSALQAQQRARHLSLSPFDRPDGRGCPSLSSQGGTIILGHSAA